MIKFLSVFSLVMMWCMISPTEAISSDKTSYIFCSTPQQSTSCNIAYKKIRSMTNPRKNKRFFDNGIYFNNDGSVFVYPQFHIAKADLDGDSFNEIIIALSDFSEEAAGYVCREDNLCMHYILQDRNIPGEEASLSRIKAFGPIYSTAIGLSTDEKVGRYRSLRGYTDKEFKNFDVYQYDPKNDAYFNVSRRE